MHTGTVVLEDDEFKPIRDSLVNSSYIKIGTLNKGMINSKQLSQKVLLK